MLHSKVHQLGMCHHVLVQVGRDHERAGDNQERDEHAKRQRQCIVGAVRSASDVKEEHQCTPI
jgi:hypothetical protein